VVRRQLPYGCWHCSGGREVLFDRRYAAICERSPGVEPRLCVGDEWISGIDRQEWFYDDGTLELEKERRAKAKLEEWGMLKAVLADVERMLKDKTRRPGPRRFRGLGQR
jgi:hypothetical protein